MVVDMSPKSIALKSPGKIIQAALNKTVLCQDTLVLLMALTPAGQYRAGKREA